MVKSCSKCKVEKSYSEFHYIGGLKRNGSFDECKKCRNEYFKNQLLIIGGADYYNKYILENFKILLRNRTYIAFKNKGYRKTSKTQEMLGVDWEVAKQHIERQFTKGMNWNNQGEWHIDHIIPLASASTLERLKELCHYTNLQPMWAEDNLIKSDKIIGQQTILRI